MKIYILESDTLKCLKTIQYESVYKDRFDKGEFKLLYPNFDEAKHVAVINDHLPKDRKLKDGKLVLKTLYEMYLDGEYELIEGQYVENEKIKTAKKKSEYEVWDFETKQYVEDLFLKLEFYRKELKKIITPYFDAFYKLGTLKLLGIETIDDTAWNEAVAWREACLNLHFNMDVNIPLENQIPVIPIILEEFVL